MCCSSSWRVLASTSGREALHDSTDTGIRGWSFLRKTDLSDALIENDPDGGGEVEVANTVLHRDTEQTIRVLLADPLRHTLGLVAKHEHGFLGIRSFDVRPLPVRREI